MLVIDDNKLKLLKMKEKLLEVSFNNRDIVLSQYKDIVIDIDRDMYDELINMIKNTNYHNQPLEEQLEILINIENEYNSFNEFQCRYRNIYEKYAGDRLELSPIEDIYIDRIKERINAINGYLINNQNLLKYRNNLEELNIQLIDAEKKKSEIEERFVLLEKELVNSVLNAEGRIDNQGELQYASIVEEFKKYNFDLKNLLSDSSLLAQELNNASVVLSSEEDKMEAARVCFNNMPNIETKRLYNVSYFDVLNANYRLVLLKLALLIAEECSSYEKIREKRINIKLLLKERVKLLNDLGIKFVIDPFDRIKINEQLGIIELLGKNIQDVLFIKEKIKDTFSLVDEINVKNNELYLIIKNEFDLFNNKDSIGTVVNDFDTQYVQTDEKKVINVRDASGGLNFDIIREKTSGVIIRVYELFNGSTITPKSEKVVPELVIEKNDIFTDEEMTHEIFEDNSVESQQDNIFVDEADSQTIFIDNNSKNDVSDDLFSEVEPFQETVLFTNKYDGVFTGDNHQKVAVNDDDKMPELFFDSERDVFAGDENDEDSELSLDEQIKALKLVA